MLGFHERRKLLTHLSTPFVVGVTRANLQELHIVLAEFTEVCFIILSIIEPLLCFLRTPELLIIAENIYGDFLQNKKKRGGENNELLSAISEMLCDGQVPANG